ncbi:CD1107 family mobile element protein [Allofournierella massiliensis]|uniref:DUF4366 domain-containing protein n=1 Tax=Allofournierella massiliensis TaxID=1650663 RepID=A0ABT7UVY8_9FIRM|nr:DUF4366 domain-containing protein [Fournierella massiliensis]MDM8202400.1 DUF4366 domain-containing protein [Fournierella massiliensis]
MKSKNVTAVLLAVFLMLGSFSMTCFADEADETSTAEKTVTVDESVDSNSLDAGTDSEKTEEEKLPYEVNLDEEGNYTFSFGDWEWSADMDEETGTDAEISNRVANYLNLRSGSGVEYEIIGQLLPGEKVQVVSEEGDWYQVVIPEKTGYVYKDYVDMLNQEEASGTVNEEFLTMMLVLMMNSMNQTGNSLPLTPDGNLTLVDDIGSATEAGQQFITLVTKSGNYFYLIIDRNDKGEETAHFLNQVDEADLLALMDEEQLKDSQVMQGTDDAENKEPQATPAATEEPEKQESSENEKKPVNMLSIAGVILALIACGGGYLMLQTKKKKASEQRPDPDVDYAEDEEEYVIPEDDEPEPVEDESDYDTEPEDSKE